MKRVAILFPGQGTQYVGMAKDLYDHYPIVQELYELAGKITGFDVAKISFEGSAEELRGADKSQPAINMHSLAVLAALCQELDIHNGIIRNKLKVTATAGLSLGEYAALYLAGVITKEDLINLIRYRGQYMQEACEKNPGGMAVVFGLEAEKLREVCEEAQNVRGGVAVVANHLLVDRHTVSGSCETIDLIFDMAVKRGARRVVKLSEVAGAYHSPLMEPASEEMIDLLDKTTFRNPKVPIVFNDTGDYAGDPCLIKEILKRQMTSPVRWWQSLKILEKDVDEFWELGPGGVLTGLVKKMFGEDKPATHISTLDDFRRFAKALL
jgi:[acyl-carrier-protein] S-malonyltransferase